ncbi:hypothetical protein [Streptomyces avidinii]|uniref:Uncharacterized protein n=1 Tax=Streptomyces avidinii TaxID=1895 RepID=A0ABS4L4H8_STRAV|nr:hypothetical protein [Streptomyces avidinii]MBP2037006.1 hypothetical protein [Streptomyces avidinii]GGY94555.1 hypothetical protein GCM10010343_19820 [Streptomyces avidinii]
MDIDAWRREDPEFTRAVTQIHEPGGLPVDSGVPARHAYWELLPGDVRARLLEKAGRCLTWWAGPNSDGRPSAVVVGDRGLCRVGQVQQGEVAEFRGQRARVEPGSLHSRTFDGRPAPDGRATAPGLPGAPVLRLDLVPEAQGVLGHFPPAVQDFLQRPFLGGDARVTADWYYDETVEPERTTWFVVLVLSTDGALALAEGTRTLDRGARPGRAEWHGIQCHRARLTPR